MFSILLCANNSKVIRMEGGAMRAKGDNPTTHNTHTQTLRNPHTTQHTNLLPPPHAADSPCRSEFCHTHMMYIFYSVRACLCL